jgi:hypothetical protein
MISEVPFYLLLISTLSPEAQWTPRMIQNSIETIHTFFLFTIFEEEKFSHMTFCGNTDA